MTFKTKLSLSVAICSTFLSACGGSGITTSPPPPPVVTDTTAPTVSFSPTALTVESGKSAASTLSATDAVGVTSGPSVTCTNGGSFSVTTNIFTAATIAANTTSVCTATAGDAAGNQGTGTLTVSMVVPTAITLAGNVVKGPISGATANILEVVTLDAVGNASGTLLATGTTATDSGFSLTIPEETQMSNLLVVEIRLAGAQMVCDAANCMNEAGVPFGGVITIPPDNTGPNDTPRIFTAAVPTPVLGTTGVNVNMFTHYQLLYMAGLAYTRQFQQGGEVVIDLQDYAPTRQRTATLFGLPDADFFTLPFIDVTQSITSTDQNAIYAALLSGGLLGAALEAAAPFDAIDIFEGQVIRRELIANELNDNPNLISVEDIFDGAIALANQIGATGNAFTAAQDALVARKVEIDAAPTDRPVAPDGTLPIFGAPLTFGNDSRTFTTAISNAFLGIINPGNLAYTATLETGQGSELFAVSPNSPTVLNLTLVNGQGSVPIGSYTLNVAFTTSEGGPDTDSIELIFTAPR